MTETNLESLRRFTESPQIKLWYEGVATELKDSTRQQYTIFLSRFLRDEDPATFLKRAQENPKPAAIEIKSRLGELYKHSMNGAHLTKYALRSFLQFHEIDMHLNGKIRVRRIRSKPELTWENANKIIQETDEPYRSLFKFMVSSGLGEDEVMEIQTSAEIQHKIDAQRKNDKSYVKIVLSPRKSTLNDFYTLVPKEDVPKFPLNTKTFGNRGAALIDPHDMQNVWRRAAKKAKIWQKGLGPHQLRSCFKSQCGKSEVAFSVSEFCMGHGGGDRYGYSREVLDEKYVAKQLGKLWEPTTVSKDEVDELRTKLTRLEEKEEARKRPDDYMNQLMADPEFERFVGRKIAQLKLKT
jgi:hypothetical protein